MSQSVMSGKFYATIARVVYEAIRVFDEEVGEKDIPKWEKADPETRARVASRIERIIRDPRAGDATFHNEWKDKRKAEGWTHARVFDGENKQDPDVVPFHLLTPEKQTRERLFRAIVLQLSRN